MERAAYMGPRLRRLRRELGLTQPGMAADLGVSASYVSLLESNARPLTADVLLRLARTYKVDLSDFAGDGGAEFTARLRAALADPLFADIDLPSLQVADVATNYPGVAEAFFRLHTAYRAEQLALAERQVGAADGLRETDPVAAVRRFMASHGNGFPELDKAGEALAGTLAGHPTIADYIATRHRLRVRVVPAGVLAGLVRRYDPHHRAIFLDERLDAPERDFQLALQLAYLEFGRLLDSVAEQAGMADENGRRLLRRALASHAAGAIRLPFTAFAAAAAETGHDLELLARRFGASIEQAATRLATLVRPGGGQIPFFFVRIDAAGNVSKRLDGAGFPFANQAASCPLWTVHHAARAPGRIVTQWLELPDGQRFFSIAHAGAAGGGGFATPAVERTIALVCAAEHADRLVYATGSAPEPTPIGITCALCQRDACPARAVPPIGRSILPDDHHRRLAPYAFADDEAGGAG